MTHYGTIDKRRRQHCCREVEALLLDQLEMVELTPIRRSPTNEYLLLLSKRVAKKPDLVDEMRGRDVF